METNYYELMCVSKMASFQSIKDAYKKLLLQNHPDKRFNSNYKGNQIDISLLQEAWRVLSSPELRNIYDASLHQQSILKNKPLHDCINISEFRIIYLADNFICENDFNTKSQNALNNHMAEANNSNKKNGESDNISQSNVNIKDNPIYALLHESEDDECQAFKEESDKLDCRFEADCRCGNTLTLSFNQLLCRVEYLECDTCSSCIAVGYNNE